MKYDLVFKKDALKEWKALDQPTKEQFRNKLKERLQKPHVKSSKLSGMKNCYKIKLRSSGFRLVYEVRDSELIVSVVAVGKRERNRVYKTAVKRL